MTWKLTFAFRSWMSGWRSVIFRLIQICSARKLSLVYLLTKEALYLVDIKSIWSAAWSPEPLKSAVLFNKLSAETKLLRNCFHYNWIHSLLVNNGVSQTTDSLITFIQIPSAKKIFYFFVALRLLVTKPTYSWKKTCVI